MHAHRFREQLEAYAAEKAPAPIPAAGGFMACPIVLVQGLSAGFMDWQVAIYRIAFERAQAQQRPSTYRRAMTPAWN